MRETNPAPPSYMQLLLGAFIVLLALLLLYVVFVAAPQGRTLILGLTLLGILGLAMGLGPLLGLLEARQSITLREKRFQDGLKLCREVFLEWDVRHEGLVLVETAAPFLGIPLPDLQHLTAERAIALVHPDDLGRLGPLVQQILAHAPETAETVQDDAFRVRNPRGEWRWCRVRWEVQERDGRGLATRIWGAASDVTDLHKCEAALIQAQRFESLGVLAGGIAHEFNNVLMGIQGFTELALECRDERDREGHLGRILEGTERASNLCKQMLAYAGRGKRQIVLHQINDSVRDSQPLMERMMPVGVLLRMQLEADLPPVMADPNQIRHALLNLVVNAADAIGGDGGEIVISTHLRHLEHATVGVGSTLQRELNGDYVCLEVQDSGSGMSQETLNRIFDPFFSTRFPGRGLGLPTVLGITRGHQGSIEVVSTPGKGSRFTLFFPAAEVRRGLETAVPPPEPPLDTPGGRILLVEDEASIRSVLRKGLERAGHGVIEAVDGVDGFGAFVRHRDSIAAVLLDLTMPRMGGRELLAEIHKLSPDTPVILMSGYSEPDALKDLEDSGLAGFLPKPCSVREALVVLQAALAKGGSR